MFTCIVSSLFRNILYPNLAKQLIKLKKLSSKVE